MCWLRTLPLVLVAATRALQLQPPQHFHLALPCARATTVVACAEREELPLDPFRALPPAAERDVAAELYAATDCARREATADRAPDVPIRPLMALTIEEAGGLTLVGEFVQNITEGRMAGATWLKPVAMRSQQDDTAEATVDDLATPGLHLFSPASLVRRDA